LRFSHVRLNIILTCLRPVEPGNGTTDIMHAKTETATQPASEKPSLLCSRGPRIHPCGVDRSGGRVGCRCAGASGSSPSDVAQASRLEPPPSHLYIARLDGGALRYAKADKVDTHAIMYANLSRVTIAERLACGLDTPTGGPRLVAVVNVMAAEAKRACIQKGKASIVEGFETVLRGYKEVDFVSQEDKQHRNQLVLSPFCCLSVYSICHSSLTTESSRMSFL
jgi:hypothetical protein